MTLAELPLDAHARVRGFRDLEPAHASRLEGLGLRGGAPVVKLLKTPLGDPIECLVGGQLLALEGWLLERILVEKA